MILITGGAWQGKREYAYSLVQTEDDRKLIIEGERCTADTMKTVKIVDRLHVWIRRQMEAVMPRQDGPAAGSFAEGWDETVFDQQEMLLCQEKITRELREVLEENPDVILIVNELGCGVIPMNVFDRRYRELVGRVCCELAKEAREVHRVVCGIGTVIKKADACGEADPGAPADETVPGAESEAAEAAPSEPETEAAEAVQSGAESEAAEAVQSGAESEAAEAVPSEPGIETAAATPAGPEDGTAEGTGSAPAGQETRE